MLWFNINQFICFKFFNVGLFYLSIEINFQLIYLEFSNMGLFYL